MTSKTAYLQKIKSTYLQKTGLVLSDDEATDFFEKLITLVKIIYQPITK